MRDSDRRLLMLGLSSDIALHLADQFLTRGTQVSGTFRRRSAELAGLERRGAILSEVDFMSDKSLQAFASAYAQRQARWDTMISAVGQLAPIGPFFSLDFKLWADSVVVNSLAQLHAVHLLYPMRDRTRPSKVVLFAGGGTNSPFDAYSAYCVGKLILIKMCELLHSEYPDVHLSIIGTGWVDSKIHDQTVAAGEAAGVNHQKTVEFREHAATWATPLADVAACIDWCLASPPSAVAGRNFSVVHDPWRDPAFIDALEINQELCKMRRVQP